MLVAPASAASATNWAKIWKKQIKPRADKRYVTNSKANSTYAQKSSLGGYYTKGQADSVFATQSDLANLVGGQGDFVTNDALQTLLEGYAKTGDSYTKAESDSNYAPKGDSYTKAESDAKYPLKSDSYTKAESDAKYPLKSDSYTKAQSDSNYYSKSVSDGRYVAAQSVLKGTFYVVGQNFTDATFALFSGSVSFGTTLSAAPTVHVVAAGDTPPVACAGGSAASPTAAAGQLCVFLRPTQNVAIGTAQASGDGFQIVDPTTTADPGASTLGFGIRVMGDGTVGHVAAYGSWAVGK